MKPHGKLHKVLTVASCGMWPSRWWSLGPIYKKSYLKFILSYEVKIFIDVLRVIY